MKDETKRTAADTLGEIHALVSTFDGVSTADAMRLGALVQEYGQKVGGEVMGPVLQGLLDVALKPRPKNPWEAQ
jgi:hypothetical protein